MSPIIQKENPILRKIAKEVSIKDINTTSFKKLIEKMSTTLAKEEDGVALAAPQIGESIRVFIISGHLLWYIKHPDEEKKPKKFPDDLIFINPKIIKLSKEKKWVDEGCLSVRYLYGKMQRSVRATIKAYDMSGKIFERGASGVIAQVFQHEVDHLDGKLFIDKAKNVELIPPEVIEKNKK